MCANIIKRRTASKPKPQSDERHVNSVPLAVHQSASEFIQGKQKLLGVAALSISIVSAASSFNIAKQYETTLWEPIMYIAFNFGLTFFLALIVSYSPAGRSIKPGGAKMKDPKMGLIGGGCIAAALWGGFGLFGPSGLITFMGLSTFILLRLP
jgi:hypothetical protein